MLSRLAAYSHIKESPEAITPEVDKAVPPKKVILQYDQDRQKDV